MNTTEKRQVILDWLGIEADQLCKHCGGRGRRAYASTATWRGGIGGQTVTADVCDRCWGTGRRDRKGANLRQLEADVRGLQLQVQGLRLELDDVAARADCSDCAIHRCKKHEAFS